MNSSLMFFLGLLIPAGMALGQGFAVAGRVVDAQTGTALARVTVSIDPVEGLQAGTPPPASPPADITTSADGGFRFAGLPPGKYRLSAARRGYLSANYEEHGNFFAAVILRPDGPPAAQIRFKLLPLASITGRVLDGSGDPVTSAMVSLFAPGYDGTGAVRMVGSTPLREGDATYEFNALAPGTYYVAVSAQPWFAVNQGSENGPSSPLDVAYPITFYPNSDLAANAEPISLRSGETAQISLTLQAVHAVHLEIRTQGNGVNTSISKPAFDGLLQSYPGAAFFHNSRDGGNIVDIAVAPGIYELGSRPGVPFDLAQSRTLSTAVPAVAPVAVTGKVAMVNGSVLPPDLTLQLVPTGADSPGQVGARRGRNGFRGRQAQPVELPMQSDGSFRADAVPAGTYRLSLGATFNDRLKITGAAASGAIVSPRLTLELGTEPVILAATVVRSSSTISGRVVDAHGMPEAGAMVILVPRDVKAETLYVQQESDSDGTWVAYGLAAGEYRAVAIRNGWDLAWKEPDVLARYLAEAGIAITALENSVTALPRDLVAQAR